MDEPLIGYLAAMMMGMALGILGGGGSVLTVPILVYLCHVKATLASSYSLWVVGIAALVGAARCSRDRLVSYRVAFLFGVPSVVGVVLARRVLLPIIPDTIFQSGSFVLSRDLLILALFALLMIGAGLAMIYQKPIEETSPAENWSDRHFEGKRILTIMVEGVGVGLVTGLVGAGGGFIIVPVLVVVLGLPMRLAVGTSLTIISAKSLIGVAADAAFWRNADWHFLTRFTVASVIGIVLGGLLAGRIPARPLKVAFGWFVLVLGTLMLTKELAF